MRSTIYIKNKISNNMHRLIKQYSMKDMKNKTMKVQNCCIYGDTKLFSQLELLCRGNLEGNNGLQLDLHILVER